MLAALALALSFGAIGCDGDAEGGEGGAGGALPGTGGDGGGGAGGEPGAGGDGGEGGSGGQGGEGGAGGAGGEGSGLCGGQECRMGEKCVEDGAVEVCRCDPDLDLCGAEMVCSPISLRCQPKPPPAVEFEPCTEPGAEAHGLECVNVQPQPLWLRPCQDTTDCALVDTFCPTEAGISSPFCSRNLCNPPTEPTHLDNGAPFGPCDASRGFLDEDTAHFGTCYPFLFSTGIQGRCERNGISTTTCKSRGSVGFADTEEICEAGMFCLETLMKGEGASCTWSTDCDPGLDCRSSTCKPKGCENDSDCGDENYCGTDKLCRALGKCETICNAGQEGKAAGEYAGCEDGQSCELFDSRMPATNPLSLGTCK